MTVCRQLVPAWQYPVNPAPARTTLKPATLWKFCQTPCFPSMSPASHIIADEALLQWFEQKSTSTAINSTCSYPNTKALIRVRQLLVR